MQPALPLASMRTASSQAMGSTCDKCHKTKPLKLTCEGDRAADAALHSVVLLLSGRHINRGGQVLGEPVRTSHLHAMGCGAGGALSFSVRSRKCSEHTSTQCAPPACSEEGRGAGECLLAVLTAAPGPPSLTARFDAATCSCNPSIPAAAD